jgi:subtilisin family serine protease
VEINHNLFSKEVFIMKVKKTKENSYFYGLSLMLILFASQAVLGGDLEITPVDDFVTSGQTGGPFSPSSKEYQLKNNGSTSLYWGAEETVNWLDLEPGWGLLNPCESTIVTVSLTSEANLLGGGIYTDTITFIDITNNEEQTREAILTITSIPGALEVTPLEDFDPTGEIGGPFNPSSKDYQLTNNGGSLIYWGATKTADWLDLDHDFGPLDPCESTIVTVSLNTIAESLGEGIHYDTLTFTDLTNAQEQTRGVTLTINVPPVWISPRSFDINTIEGLSLTEILTIGNDSSTDLNFTIRTRQVGASKPLEEATAIMSTGIKGGIFSAPEGQDFTVAGDAPYKPGELIVRFAANTDGRLPCTEEKNQLLNSVGGGKIKYDFKIVPGLSVVELPEWTTVEQALLALNGADGILYAQPNYEVKALSTFPNDPRFDELWGMHNTGQTGGTFDADIDAPEAWDIATGSHEIVVAVIDTGVDYTHVDLATNMWINEAEFNGSPGVDDDNNGYVDDIYGYDFCNNDGDPKDDHYHGTHCAGTIGAVGNNSEGVAGVCWNVKIMALKFLDSGGRGWTDDAIKCVQYSVLMGANLSSNSWGGGSYSQGLKDAIDAAGAAGMLFVAAAGNDGVNNDVDPHYPSSYDCESLIAVMATMSDDGRSVHPGWASNYGPASVDLGAPGSSILSCEPGNQYGIHSGTSMATPHVSGACALLWSTNPLMSNNEVKDILLRTVDKTLTGLCVSEGRLNLYSAALETSTPWIKIEPEAGTIAPGESYDISVTFDAIELAPAIYQAEIVIISNEPDSPRIVPVTMTVNLDDLQVTPVQGFESSGTEGGPFEPQCTVYTLTNIGTEPVYWTTHETVNWLQISPYEGVLDASETIDVNVCISAEANSLDPNIYNETLIFENTDSGSIKPRSLSLTVKPPDCFTEYFSEIGIDLSGFMLTLSPDGSTAYYEACRDRVTQFPTDPNGGTYVPLWDDDFVEIVLSDANVLFYGQRYDRFYIGSNGYITFGDGDTQFSPSLENHFAIPRISALFADLDPPNDKHISYKQLDDRVVVTFQDVPLYGDKTTANSFQIEMFFTDGTICITWLDTAPTASVVGLSRGRGLPPAFFEQSDLSSYPPCWPRGDFNRDYSVDMNDLAIFVDNWLCADCNIPNWCQKTDLDFSSMVQMADFAFFADNWMTKVDWWLLPISHWKFDEGSGTTVYDSIGNNHGTIYGAAWTAGQINGALSFDGQNDYVGVPDDASLDITGDITISAWVQLTKGGLEQGIVTKCVGNGPTNNPFDFRTDPSPEPLLTLVRAGATGHDRVYSDKHISLNQWHHVLVRVENKVPDFYVDGIITGKWADTIFTKTPTGNAKPVLIGARDDGLFFNGKIDQVRIYDRALSAKEIQELFQEGISKKAFAPYPTDGKIFVDPNVVLSWLPGKGALSHDVYLGMDYNDVNDANTLSDEYKGNYDVNSYDPCGLDLETTYYWRIDEVGASTTYKGDVWSFTTWAEPPPDCVSWWMFDEGTGTVAYDSVGNNHGAVLGAAWTTGKVNGALSFDGQNDYVSVPHDVSLNITGDITISAWVQFTRGGLEQGIVTKCVGSGPTNNPFDFRTDPSSEPLLTLVRAGATGHERVYSDKHISLNQWHHVLVRVENKVPDFYVDGIITGKWGDTTFTKTPTGNSKPVLIGRRDDGLFFNGIIDEVLIYDRALTLEEIGALYQN